MGPMRSSSIKETEDAAPKRIVKLLERTGDKYAWVDRSIVDWGGKQGETETWIAGLPDGAFALPLLENGNILLVHQYRFATRGWSYEIPGGIIDEGESEEATVIRELEEEIGQTPKELRKLAHMQINVSSRGCTPLYLATKLTKKKRRGDDGEHDLTVHELTPTQVWEMIMDGTIFDVRTIVAFLLAKELGLVKIDKKRLEKHPF